MKYIDLKKCLALLSSSVVLLSGCGNNSKKDTNPVTRLTTAQSEIVTTGVTTTEEIKPETTTITKETTKSETTTITEETTKSETTTITEETKSETTIEKNDEMVVSYFESIKDNVKKYINKENFETVKDKTIDSVIVLTDFIFYGTEIKGVTFDELKDETKQIIIDSFIDMDELIMTKFPNYKEVITEKTGHAYDVIVDKVNSLKNKGKEKIVSKVGEEKYSEYVDKYNRVKEEYHEVMDDTKKDVSEVKQKIKTWYENKTGK